MLFGVCWWSILVLLLYHCNSAVSNACVSCIFCIACYFNVVLSVLITYVWGQTKLVVLLSNSGTSSLLLLLLLLLGTFGKLILSILALHDLFVCVVV